MFCNHWRFSDVLSWQGAYYTQPVFAAQPHVIHHTTVVQPNSIPSTALYPAPVPVPAPRNNGMAAMGMVAGTTMAMSAGMKATVNSFHVGLIWYQHNNCSSLSTIICDGSTGGDINPFGAVSGGHLMCFFCSNIIITALMKAFEFVCLKKAVALIKGSFSSSLPPEKVKKNENVWFCCPPVMGESAIALIVSVKMVQANACWCILNVFSKDPLLPF